MINVLSLFDGLSGARIALDKLGIKCNYYASEIDKYAIQVSKYNYPDIIQLGDINDIIYSDNTLFYNNGKSKNLHQIDLMIGGSPCQDLSVAKKDRKGLKGERSGLFYEYVRLLKEIKPKYFLLENVNSMPKESKKLITEILGVEPIMINSALVSAQNRKRLYWTNIPGIIQPEDKNIYLKDILEEYVDEKYFIIKTNELNWIKNSIKIKKTHTKINGDKSLCLTTRTYANWNGTYCVAQRGRYNKDGSTSQQLETRFDGKTNTLTNVQKDNYVSNKSNIRKLTPIECERLQTIPDNYTSIGINEKGEEVKISNSQRYKMIGNGFTCDVIAYILSFAKWGRQK